MIRVMSGSMIRVMPGSVIRVMPGVYDKEVAMTVVGNISCTIIVVLCLIGTEWCMMVVVSCRYCSMVRLVVVEYLWVCMQR